ncbi:MAG TPA: S41 family peptidase [Planktothrix sp.]|jgi:carboxyl-terminal processing protease
MNFRTIRIFTLLSLMFIPAVSFAAQAENKTTVKADTPEQLETDYRATWQFIGDRYYDESKLGDWSAWQHRFDGKLHDRNDLYQALKTMTASINDPWTGYYSPADIEAKKAPDAGHVSAGFWILLDKSGAPYVELCEQGKPAYRSVIRAGDTIVSVNGTAVAGMTAERVQDLLAGPVGQSLTVEYGDGANHNVSTIVLSEPEEVQSQARMLSDGVLYAKLAAFNRDDIDAFEQAIDKALAKQKEPRGMILDLRGNPGGFVKGAQYVASMFIEKGVLFTYQSRDGITVTRETMSITEAPFASDSPADSRASLLRRVPLVILIDHTTRSAAETVTVALKENGRARVIGEQSYGKSIAYDNFPQDFGGGLELTIANISSPNGYSWQGKGLTPDVVVARPRVMGTADLQLDAAVANLR